MDNSAQNGAPGNGLSSTPTDTPVTPVAEEVKKEETPVTTDSGLSSTPTETGLTVPTLPETTTLPATEIQPSAEPIISESTALVTNPTMELSATPLVEQASSGTTVAMVGETPVSTEPLAMTPSVESLAPGINTSTPSVESSTPGSSLQTPVATPDTSVLESSTEVVTPAVDTTVPAPVSEPIPVEPEGDAMAATIAVAPPPQDAATPSGAATAGSVVVSSGSSKKGIILAVVTVLLLAGLALGAYFMFMQPTTPAVPETKPITKAEPVAPTVPPVDQQALKEAKDTSDIQLNKDADKVDAAMQSLDTSLSSVDAGLADKPVSLN